MNNVTKMNIKVLNKNYPLEIIDDIQHQHINDNDYNVLVVNDNEGSKVIVEHYSLTFYIEQIFKNNKNFLIEKIVYNRSTKQLYLYQPKNSSEKINNAVDELITNQPINTIVNLLRNCTISQGLSDINALELINVTNTVMNEYEKESSKMKNIWFLERPKYKGFALENDRYEYYFDNPEDPVIYRIIDKYNCYANIESPENLIHRKFLKSVTPFIIKYQQLLCKTNYFNSDHNIVIELCKRANEIQLKMSLKVDNSPSSNLIVESNNSNVDYFNGADMNVLSNIRIPRNEISKVFLDYIDKNRKNNTYKDNNSIDIVIEETPDEKYIPSDNLYEFFVSDKEISKMEKDTLNEMINIETIQIEGLYYGQQINMVNEAAVKKIGDRGYTLIKDISRKQEIVFNNKNYVKIQEKALFILESAGIDTTLLKEVLEKFNVIDQKGMVKKIDEKLYNYIAMRMAYNYILVLSGDVVEESDVISAIANAYAIGGNGRCEIADDTLEEFTSALAEDVTKFRM